MPQGSDSSWAQKLYQTHLSSSYFQKPKRPRDAFVVRHFAGKVGKAVAAQPLAGGARQRLRTSGRLVWSCWWRVLQCPAVLGVCGSCLHPPSPTAAVRVPGDVGAPHHLSLLWPFPSWGGPGTSPCWEGWSTSASLPQV
uniref:Myosin motor domain-containing protein n=1 Tax=Athene cunicularia TaxID=194338 RepID=A0A663MPR3_ATHCN